MCVDVVVPTSWRNVVARCRKGTSRLLQVRDLAYLFMGSFPALCERPACPKIAFSLLVVSSCHSLESMDGPDASAVSSRPVLLAIDKCRLWENSSRMAKHESRRVYERFRVQEKFTRFLISNSGTTSHYLSLGYLLPISAIFADGPAPHRLLIHGQDFP